MPNSFYRFQPAWNAGFYPDNQITANLLNELAGNIGAWLPGFFPGKTLSQLVAGVTGQMDNYNVSPYFGGLSLTYQTIPDIPNYEYNINIINADLSATDNSQVVIINGFFNNTTKEVLSANLVAFTPGSYSGSFDYSPIPVESEVDRALQIVEQNGSAFFPLTYSFDSGSNIATSGLARGKNWQLDSSGNPTRLPADTLPKQNARTFSVTPQTAEDRYCISLMEKVINFSFTNTVAIEVRDYFNSFTIPDGWTRGSSIVAGTYERIYLNLYRDDRSLLMIGRLDTTWLWQRFLDDSGTNDITYFIDYSSTTPLPYLPLSSYQWLYNDWYDMEFVEFNSGCYESPEFYAMPAIPGDNWQFNVPSDSGNLTGLSTASVGLFSQDGQFIQQVGDAVRNCCFEAYFPYVIVDGSTPAFDNWVSFVDTYLVTTPLQFFFSNQTTNYTGLTAGTETGDQIGAIAATLPAGTVTTYNKQDFIDAVAALSWPAGIVVTGSVVSFSGNEVVELKFCNYLASEYPSIQAKAIVEETPFFFSYVKALCCEPQQFQATSLIPAVASGCYRLGLYNIQETGGSNTCQLTFEYIIDSPEAYVDGINFYSQKWLAFALYDGANLSQIYTEQIPSTEPPATGFDLAQIIDFANGIPGMVATYDEETAYLTYNWTVTVPCNQEFSFRHLVLNEDDSVVDLIFSTETQLCTCEVVDLNAYSLYSLSNIINIDGSDCFSTMLEFWANDNSIAQGFEYFNNWKQRVRLGINGGGAKPVIEENLYRQSNGVHRRPQNKQDLSLDLHTDFIDPETQLALVDATRHPYLVWDNKSIFVKGDIDVATIQDFTTQSSFETLAQVKFSALLQGFQPKNSSCLTC
jgi:hypothetical protein